MTIDNGMYLTQGLHRALQQKPHALATIFAGRRRTFNEQADRVSRLAGGLRDLGVRDGARVGILALNSDRYAELLLAIPWADGAFNAIDIMRSPFEIAPMLSESETAILFVDDAFAPAVPALRDAWPGLRTVVHMGDEPSTPDTIGFEELIEACTPLPDARRGGDALAGLLHTGGTTNSPKAVMLAHQSLVGSMLGLGATLPSFVRSGTRLLQITPMSHVSGVGSFFMQSLHGNTYVPLRRFEPTSVLAAIETHQITAMFLVPTMLQQMVDHPDIGTRHPDSVRTIAYGASPITEAVLDRAMSAFPQASFAQVYGMTETTSFTVLAPEDHDDKQVARSAGRAPAYTEVRVVDIDDQDVPIGTRGQILLRGVGMMLGYWKDPDATAEALRGGWMHTGDVGYLDESGYVYVVDRLKDLIIVRGDNVHSSEVENALASHPDVATCAVIGVPDGETGERVHALVVPQPQVTPDSDQLRKHCASLIAEYKVPSEWEFVDALPTSPTGKVLKRELRSRHWEGRQRPIN